MIHHGVAVESHSAMSDEKAVYTAEKAEVELAYVSADLGVTSGRPRGFTGGRV